MNEDVIGLIIRYCREMDALRTLLRDMKKHYGFLESACFESLDDVLRFEVFLQMELNVNMFMCTGVPSCGDCDHLRHGVWLYISQDSMSVGTIVEFLRESNQCCEHEVVSQMFKSGETLNILIKDVRTRDATSITQTQRASYNN